LVRRRNHAVRLRAVGLGGAGRVRAGFADRDRLEHGGAVGAFRVREERQSVP